MDEGATRRLDKPRAVSFVRSDDDRCFPGKTGLEDDVDNLLGALQGMNEFCCLG